MPVQKPVQKSPDHRNYHRVAQAVAYLLEHQGLQPTLSELASQIGLSESHLQRTFTQWVGVSPKQFLQFLTKEKAKSLMAELSVFDSALQSGLSGGGRLYDLMVRYECVTPGEYKSRGDGVDISYGVHACPFGYCFIASTHRGVCKLSFLDCAEDGKLALQELSAQFVSANLFEDQKRTSELVEKIFVSILEPRSTAGDTKTINILLSGTPFRMQVWEALLNIPPGCITSYQQVAEAIGKPKAVRAVASAIASNEIGYLIPCHRVIRASGALSQYRWGMARKGVMLGCERVAVAKSIT